VVIRADVVRGCAFGGCLAALCVSIDVAGAAEPAPVPERVRISYTLAADCPAPEAFEQRIDTRLGAAWKAEPGEAVRTFAIVATSSAAGASVSLEYQDREGRDIARSVEAKTCAEALDVMAVITAVAIDAQTREPEKAATPPSEEPPAPASAAPPPPAKEPTPALQPEPAPARPPGPAWIHELGARASIASGFGPRVAYGVGVEWGLVAPSGMAVRAAVEGRDTFEVPANDGRARFRALTGRGEFCPFALRLARFFGVPLCAGLEGGVLWGDGVVAPPAVTFETTSPTPWFAVLVTPRLRFAEGSLFAELGPELRFPLIGHTFVFQNPERIAYEIPHVAFSGALSAGFRFH